MGAKNLRKVEKLVLSRLELDSRVPFSRFHPGIRKSQQVVSYTVNSLLKKEIIQNFYTLIDYSKLDVINFRVYFKLSYFNKKKFRELVNHLVLNPHTSWITTCSGRHDLICTFLALNPSQFNKTLKSLIAKFPELIQDYNVLTTIVRRWFGRKYLFGDMPSQIIFGGDRQPEAIDRTDLRILNELSEDARKSSVKIGELLSLTPKTIIQRIKKLNSMKIIKGFKPLLNLGNLGYVSNLLLIKYHNVSPELENRLIRYLKAHRNIISIVKTLGEWDIEIEIETPNAMVFRKIEMEIRQKFPLLIQQIESVNLYKTHKKNYFPKFLI
ncbi:Lrp/AsnC family transcriptional regulator [Candidatus Woesearchaeota archaeon]|nr:Lrp/AsnC family transcriptional regulator [Candidatus Woesearchaeota archaeon]